MKTSYFKRIAIAAVAAFLSACGGGGGGTSSQQASVAQPTPVVQPAPAPTPIPVLKSSYENKIAAGKVLGPQSMPPEVATSNAVAFADFFQDGTYSMVTSSSIYNVKDPSTANQFGSVRFYKNVNGKWVDNTSKLLTDVTGCLHPRKAIVADFNGDHKPDVFFACHGFDAAPYPGEKPHMLLSQADGTYKNTTLPFTGFIHSASAADFSGNGYADILITDNITKGTPYFLVNNKDGTFTADTSKLPANLMLKPIFTAELIDFGTGKYDAVLAGDESGFQATIFRNDTNNNYVGTAQVTLPTDPTNSLPLDIVFNNGSIYLLRTNTTNAATYGVDAYTKASIQKINYTTLASETVYSHTGQFSNGMTWINWLIVDKTNTISSMDASYQVTVN